MLLVKMSAIEIYSGLFFGLAYIDFTVIKSVFSDVLFNKLKTHFFFSENLVEKYLDL